MKHWNYKDESAMLVVVETSATFGGDASDFKQTPYSGFCLVDGWGLTGTSNKAWARLFWMCNLHQRAQFLFFFFFHRILARWRRHRRHRLITTSNQKREIRYNNAHAVSWAAMGENNVQLEWTSGMGWDGATGSYGRVCVRVCVCARMCATLWEWVFRGITFSFAGH